MVVHSLVVDTVGLPSTTGSELERKDVGTGFGGRAELLLPISGFEVGFHDIDPSGRITLPRQDPANWM